MARPERVLPADGFGDLGLLVRVDLQSARRHETGQRHGGRADGVDADAEGGRLDRDTAGELDDPALGGAVHRAAPADQTRHRTGVEDDAAATLLLELQHRVLAAEEHPAEVDRDQPVEVLERVVLERHAESRRRDADVVEQDVEPTELVDRGRDHGLDLLLVRDVGPDGDGGAARRLDLAHSLFRWSSVDVGATTRAPSSANRSADTRPTPEPAPVTMALLPSSTPAIGLRVRQDGRLGRREPVQPLGVAAQQLVLHVSGRSFMVLRATSMQFGQVESECG